jgi:hypothetical protein
MSVHILLASMAGIGCSVSFFLLEMRTNSQFDFLGGKLLNDQRIIDIALELVDSCWNTYASTT